MELVEWSVCGLETMVCLVTRSLQNITHQFANAMAHLRSSQKIWRELSRSQGLQHVTAHFLADLKKRRSFKQMAAASDTWNCSRPSAEEAKRLIMRFAVLNTA